MSVDTRQFVFETPNAPEEFGVALPPPELRRLDFSALDYQNNIRAIIEYIRTYHPNDFNDFFASNGIIMLAEVFSYLANVLSQRSDILIDEAFLPTANTKQAVIQHLALINQAIQRATPATVDIQLSIDAPIPTEIRVPAGTRFSFPGPDSKSVFFEVFRAPGDFTSPISIPPGKRGVIAFGIEGLTSTPLTVVSEGGPDQFIDINNTTVLDEPIFVTINTGNTTQSWQRVDIIQKAGPQDEVFEVRHNETATRIVFGNDVAGKSPLAGQTITVVFRSGGGARGRIGANTINEIRPITPLPPASAVIEILFQNPAPSQGGTDEETIDHAKRRAPSEFATHDSAVTGEDYGLLASAYNHPVYGSVAKAVGTIRTGVDKDITALAIAVRAAPDVSTAVNIMKTQFINRNIVEVYVLAQGPNNVPITPSAGLKQGLVSFFSDINVLTDEVRILNGAIKPVDVKATIVMSRNADPGTVKVSVQNAITNFFDIANFDMGTAFNLSTLYNLIQVIPGVKYVNIFEPPGNIPQIDPQQFPDINGVAFNEVITLGNVDLKFFFEPGGFRIPAVGQRSNLPTITV